MLKATPREEVLDDGKFLPRTWEMNKKTSGHYKARLNACW